MSMPTKGKQQHHLPHHHQHHHHQQQQHHNPHQQHPLVVNVNQPGVHHLAQGYSTVVATSTQRYVSNAGSEFHVPAQNYGAQPGGQVGGGGGSVGVPGGRGPPPLGGIPTIGQSTAGIPPGGPAGGQAPPQAQAPGVQTQQTQGPAPTTTPPVHTPSPQEMGKQPHLQAHSYYPAAPRPQQPRSLNHRSGQGGSGNQVVGMPGVGGGGGQPVMYTTNLAGQPGTVYVPSHVAGLSTGPHQQPVYHMNNQIIQFSSAPQRHQAQNQSFYPPYQPHALLAQNLYPYQPGPTPQPGFFFTSPTAPLNLNRSSATAVSGGAQHVGGALGGAQGATMVPQGTLQQPAQQPQPLPQIDVYSGYNGGGTTGTSSSIRSKKPRGEKAITDIVNPSTGKNISHEIYDDDATVESGESSSRETPQPQNSSGAEVVADFAARVAKAATESSDSGSPVATVVTTAETFASQIATQSLSNIQQTNSSNETNNQCNANGPPTPTLQNISNLHALCSQSSLDTTSTSSNVTQIETVSPSSSSCPPPSSATPSSISSSSSTHSSAAAAAAVAAAAAAAAATATATSASSASSSSSSSSSCAVKTAVESKPLQILAKEFQPRGEKKTVSSSSEETVAATVVAAAVVNVDVVPTAQPAVTPTPVVDQQEPKRTTSPPSVNLQTPTTPQQPQQQTQQQHQHQPHSQQHQNQPHSQQHQHQPQPQQHQHQPQPQQHQHQPQPQQHQHQPQPQQHQHQPQPQQHQHQPQPQQHQPQPQQHQHQPQPQQHQHQQQPQQQQQQSQSHSVPSTTTVQEVTKLSSTAAVANPVPVREPFSNPSSKTTSSNSPPRRKSQSHNHGQSNNAIEQQLPPPPPPPPSAKEQKEKKREKSLSSRGATPAPAAHNQPDHHHHHQKSNGDASADKTEQEPVAVARNDVQQHKQNDGKAMQKQKSKNKLKPRELNRKGAEKEGTDMDAFVNTAPPAKTEVKQQQDNKESMQLKDSNKEPVREITKETKEKDNYESKKEKEVTTVHPQVEKHVIQDIVKESAPVQTPIIEKLSNEKEITKEVSSKVEDNSKAQNACNTQIKSVPNDVVDHASVKEDIDLEAIVAQKNEENTKISAFQAVPTEEKIPTVPATEESDEQNEPKPPADTTVSKSSIQLKYKYKDDQWSPLNKSGKKVYDREFLIRLQDDPNSRIKPTNLPDLEIVLKDITKTRSSTLELRAFQGTSISKPDSLFPGFVKPALTRVLPTNRKSHPCQKPVKSAKPHIIHLSLSLREDVKLRETENAWRPTRLKPVNLTEEETKTEALYKKVRSVLNKLTPQKFNKLVEQVRALQIDTQERLQGVINLVFEKAVDEPNFSVAYALMCKELALMEAGGHDKSGDKATEGSVNFRKLILGRCQQEFEKNPIDEVARTSKLKEIEECTDPEKKKDLQQALEEEDRRIRIKSVGNIRFIGELYKQGMLTRNIMHRCITHLLDQNDEDNLECLCKLLTTIGKDLESKGKSEKMQEYFNKMQDIVGRRGHSKISSRIRFMLQDVIDLRANEWIPRRDDSNPKTIDQIQKEVESERLDTQLNNTPLNTPRKDDRNSDRKRNRGFGPADEGGWSQPVSRTRQTYSVETAKLRNKPPPMDDLQLGSRNMYMWKNPASSSTKTINSNKFALLENVSAIEQEKRMQPVPLSGSRSTGPRDYGRDYKSSYDGRGSRNGSHQLSSASSSRESSLLDNSQSQNVSLPTQPMKSVSQTAPSTHKPPLSEEAFTKALNSILKDYLSEHILENAISDVKETFDNATFTKFVRESINFVLEKSPAERERVSRLMSQLISRNIMSVQHLKAGFSEVLEIVDDLIIDIPKIWTYLTEILTCPIKNEVMPLSEMRDIFISLRSQGYAGKLLGELLSKLSREKGSKWITDKWDQSRLSLNDIINPDRESVNKMVKEYHLEFLVGDYNSAKSSISEELSLQQIHEQLKKLMKENTFDEISSWITEHVGNRVKDPKFITTLMTAILETSIVLSNGTWKLNENTLGNLELLIHRFVDTDEVLELQCLYAIEAYMTKIEFPCGILRNIINKLSMDNIISSDAFLAWQKSDNPAEHRGHSVAIMMLTAFFTSLQEAEDSSSVEDGPSNVNSDRC